MDYTKYEITFEDIMDILKEFGGHTGYVWLTNTDTDKVVMIKYDSTRRYFMSNVVNRLTEFNRDSNLVIDDEEGNSYHFETVWKKRPTLQRVPQDVFESNVRFLISHGYYICF